MRVSTTVILGLLSIALAVVTAWLDREKSTGKSAAASANVLVRFDPEIVDRIEVAQGTKKTVIERLEGSWFFKEPEVDRVDQRAVAALFDELNHLTIIDRISPSEADQTLAQLGVAGDRSIRISLGGESDDGELVDETVVLGDSAPREGSLYALLTDSDEVLGVDGAPRRWIEDPLATMRDRKVLSAPVETIVQLGIGRSTGEVVLQRNLTPPQQDWAVAEPRQAWADRGKVD